MSLGEFSVQSNTEFIIFVDHVKSVLFFDVPTKVAPDMAPEQKIFTYKPALIWHQIKVTVGYLVPNFIPENTLL